MSRIGQRLQERDQDDPLADPRNFGRGGLGNAHDRIGLRVDLSRLDGPRAGLRVAGVEVARGLASTALDEYLRAGLDEPSGDVRHQGHAALAGLRLPRDSDLHGPDSMDRGC